MKSYDVLTCICVHVLISYLCVILAFVATFKDLKKNKTQLTTVIPPIIHQVLHVSMYVCMFVCLSTVSSCPLVLLSVCLLVSPTMLYRDQVDPSILIMSPSFLVISTYFKYFYQHFIISTNLFVTCFGDDHKW